MKTKSTIKMISRVFLVVFLVSIFPFSVLAQSDELYISEGNRLSLSQFSDEFSMYSLDEFNEKFGSSSASKPGICPPLRFEDADDVTKSTKSRSIIQTKPILLVTGTSVGSITLQYETWILGGRPQFMFLFEVDRIT